MYYKMKRDVGEARHQTQGVLDIYRCVMTARPPNSVLSFMISSHLECQKAAAS